MWSTGGLPVCVCPQIVIFPFYSRSCSQLIQLTLISRKKLKLCLVQLRKHLKFCHTPVRKLAFLTWLVITAPAPVNGQASMSFFMRNESLSSRFIQPSTIKLIPPPPLVSSRRNTARPGPTTLLLSWEDVTKYQTNFISENS